MRFRNRPRDTFSNRYYVLVIFIAFLMALLALRLFVVTVVEHEKWSRKATDQSTKMIYTSAPRGDILDRNGKVIATTRQMFTVTFNSSSLDTKQINDASRKVLNLLEQNGDTYKDDFPIRIRKDGSMYYTYDVNKEKWLKSEGFHTDFSPSQTFLAMRRRYGIPDSMSRYDAYDKLTDVYKVNVPISVKNMHYTYDQQRTNFISKWGVFTDDEVKKGVSAEKCFRALRKQYKVSKSLSDREARKIFVVRNKVVDTGQRYTPVTLAKDVSKKTIAMVEESGIDGVSVSSQYRRYYPFKSSAAHILGYMGAISDSQSDYYVKKRNYNSDDLIGQEGIESRYEKQLHGTPGVQKIQVNSSGSYVRTISRTKSKKGKNVKLTIDMDLQQAAEKALASGIAHAGGNCQSGAVICMDVKTGQILAMASNPSYDPNIFSDGITTKAWKSVQSENPRDVIAPAPLYNNATMASVAPGSTFKPITAMTALQCGLNPNTMIHDNSYIEIGGHKWATSAYNEGGGSYGDENLELGIGHSSNYYFYCIGTGKNWGTGASLGYKIGVNDIVHTASEFGLGHATGVELRETVSPLPSKKRKMESYVTACWQYLYQNAHKFFPSSVADDYNKLSGELDTISAYVRTDPSYDQIVEDLKKTDMKASRIPSVATAIKYNYCIQAKWSTGDQFNLSIGQGDNSYTPLQLATYISALGNGGKYTHASVVKQVGDRVIDKTKSARTIDLKKNTVPDVLKGMRKVCTGGTLQSFFGSYKVPVAGKTGTAQNQGIRQPKSEVKYIRSNLGSLNSRAHSSVTWSQVEKNMTYLMRKYPTRYSSKDDAADAAVMRASNYRITQTMIDSGKGSYDYYAWTETLAPYNNPRIAVVTLLIQGGFSSNAAPVNKSVISSYYKLYNAKTGQRKPAKKHASKKSSAKKGSAKA